MYDHVIVPLDGTSHAESAIPLAAEEARRYRATLVLFHVVPRPEPPMRTEIHGGPVIRPIEWPAADLQEGLELGRRYLEQVHQRYCLPPDTVLTVVVGEPVHRILAEAERRSRSLVVLTTGDMTADVCPPLSEVARRVLVAGTAPVLGVRTRQPGSSWPGANCPDEQHLDRSEDPMDVRRNL